uniref:Uncharacterized protein n=1 Tax=Glossina palpalis gambiensis TaxID=67801 RepID=A0A1B0BV47_9MUSC
RFYCTLISSVSECSFSSDESSSSGTTSIDSSIPSNVLPPNTNLITGRFGMLSQATIYCPPIIGVPPMALLIDVASFGGKAIKEVPNGGLTPSTAIELYPKPNIPSNLAATKAKPGSLNASAKVCPSISKPAIFTVSVDK